jgi:hypothetical protein
MDRPSNLPNNLGPTLLIALGFVTLPALIGLPVLLYGLVNLRAHDGRRTFAALLPRPAQPRV